MDFNYKDFTFIKLPLNLEGKVFAVVTLHFPHPPSLVANHYAPVLQPCSQALPDLSQESLGTRLLVLYIEYIPKKMLEEPSE